MCLPKNRREASIILPGRTASGMMHLWRRISSSPAGATPPSPFNSYTFLQPVRFISTGFVLGFVLSAGAILTVNASKSWPRWRYKPRLKEDKVLIPLYDDIDWPLPSDAEATAKFAATERQLRNDLSQRNRRFTDDEVRLAEQRVLWSRMTAEVVEELVSIGAYRNADEAYSNPNGPPTRRGGDGFVLSGINNNPL